MSTHGSESQAQRKPPPPHTSAERQSFVFERDIDRIVAEDFPEPPAAGIVFSQGNFGTTESMRRGAEITCGLVDRTRRYLGSRRQHFRSWKNRGRIWGQWDRRDVRKKR